MASKKVVENRNIARLRPETFSRMDDGRGRINFLGTRGQCSSDDKEICFMRSVASDSYDIVFHADMITILVEIIVLACEKLLQS